MNLRKLAALSEEALALVKINFLKFSGKKVNKKNITAINAANVPEIVKKQKTEKKRSIPHLSLN